MRRWLPCLCLAFAACGQAPAPEDEIREWVAEAEQAAEARDARSLKSLIAEDYRDGRGVGAEELRRYVQGYLIAHQSVHLLVRVEEIEFPATDLARLRATVGMLGREADGPSAWDLAAEVYDFDVSLAREDGDWRVIRAEWRPALGR